MPEERPSAATGAQFGKYRIVRKLGEGAFGAVFEALLPGPMGFTKRVAIKMLRRSVVTTDPKFVQSMVNEARIGGLLHHGNIVDVMEFDQVGESYYLAMEFVDGLTLGEVIRLCRCRQTLLPRFATLELVGDVCRGLHYAHEFRDPAGQPLELIHRDLKPSNIIVNAEGRAKILDFGIAKAASNLFNTTASAVSKGTPRYMSPEQVACEPLTPRSDLFSLGAVMFEMITGRVLFDADHIAGLVMKIMGMELTDHLDQAEAAFPGARPILERALKKDPQDRYPSALAMAEDVRELGKRYPAEADMTKVFARLLPARDRTASVEIQDSGDLDFETRVYRGEEDDESSYGTSPIPPPDPTSVGWEQFSRVFAEPTRDSSAVTEAWEDARPAHPVVLADGGTPATPHPHDDGPSSTRAAPADGDIRARGTPRVLTAGVGVLAVAVAVLAVLVLSDRLRPDEPSPSSNAVETTVVDTSQTEGEEPLATPGPATPAPVEPTTPAEQPPPTPVAEPPVEDQPPQPTAEAGTISIRSKPYARIYVDDVLVKEGNVLSRHTLPGGPHTVRLECPNLGDAAKEFTVDIDGQDASLGCWDFEKEGPCGS